MKNIKVKNADGTLTLTIDLKVDHGRSKSGKSTIIATTGGNKEIALGVYMGLNIYRKI